MFHPSMYLLLPFLIIPENIVRFVSLFCAGAGNITSYQHKISCCRNQRQGKHTQFTKNVLRGCVHVLSICWFWQHLSAFSSQLE